MELVLPQAGKMTHALKKLHIVERCFRTGAEGKAAPSALHESKGIFSFAKENIPFGTPREREGRAPRPPTLAVSISKNCSACGIRCGVHGFAMNPYCSLPLATAPYYREARVTITWRQTACGMRHCFARRIEECRGRRILVCTPTRSAERQRIIGVGQIV